MFGLGVPEILLILAIALIVIGPKKLPDLAKTMGRAMGEFKNAAQNFKKSIETENSIKEFKNSGDIIKKDIKDTVKDINNKADEKSDQPEQPEESEKPDDTYSASMSDNTKLKVNNTKNKKIKPNKDNTDK
ncbi:MAG: hypothetical protein B6I26_04470 [Desulfobacteraceae bacterium 4572_130]|nr:MAG: hypothetical protein B6I26_04470 [Desulfobacteraceae bacterium 4572_130]